MIAILMMSAKLATLGLLKIKIFWNECYDFKISVYDVTNKILLRESNHIVDVITWPKFDNSSISMWEVLKGFDLTKKLTFLMDRFGSSWIIWDWLITLKLYTSVANWLKLKVRKLFGIILTFVEIRGGKNVRRASPSPRVGLNSDIKLSGSKTCHQNVIVIGLFQT